MSVGYKHVDLPMSKLHFLARQGEAPVGCNLLEWYLEKHAPGKLIGVTSFLQPVPGSQVHPQGQQIEPVFHFFFEVARVIQ